MCGDSQRETPWAFGFKLPAQYEHELTHVAGTSGVGCGIWGGFGSEFSA